MTAYFREVRPTPVIAHEILMGSLVARVINATRGPGQRASSIDDVLPWSEINRIKAKGQQHEMTVEEWQTMMRHTYGG